MPFIVNLNTESEKISYLQEVIESDSTDYKSLEEE